MTTAVAIELLEAFRARHPRLAAEVDEIAAELVRSKPLAERDDMIRELAATLPPGTFSQTARGVHELLNNYSPTWQRVDRYRSSMPASYAGTPAELLFRIYAISDKIPGPSRIRHLLAAGYICVANSARAECEQGENLDGAKTGTTVGVDQRHKRRTGSACRGSRANA